MMKFEYSRHFQKEIRRIAAMRPDVKAQFDALFDLLASGQPLPAHYRDHPLKGNYRGYRDCHLGGDLVIIYSRTAAVIRFSRIGSHSELFG